MVSSSIVNVPSSWSRTKLLIIGTPVLVAVFVAWYLYHSCRRSELCIVNTPLYVILALISYVLPENPLDRNVTSFREHMRTSKATCDLSRYIVDNVIARPGDVPVRIYQPHLLDNTLLRPVVIWFHGGGFVLGDYEDDVLCTKISEYTHGSIVISVKYRLAPEHPFPAAIEDGAAALQWIKNNVHRYGGNNKQIILSGESAGGTLAVSLAAMNYDTKYTSRFARVPLAGMFLLYPCLEVGTYRDSAFKYGSSMYPILSLPTMLHFWSMYLGPSWSVRNDYRAIPMRIPDAILKQLPPTLIALAKFDILLDEGLVFSELLRQANVPVTTLIYNDTVHGFFAKPGLATEAQTKEIVSGVYSLLTQK